VRSGTATLPRWRAVPGTCGGGGSSRADQRPVAADRRLMATGDAQDMRGLSALAGIAPEGDRVASR